MKNKKQLNASYTSGHAIYLVLQGEQAFWFKYSNGEVIDSFVDRVDDDAWLSASRCPWISEESSQQDTAVHLILNTAMDELDHVALNEKGAGLFGYINRYRCLKNLRKDYAQASVFALPQRSFPVIANLLHHVIPDHWSQWLIELQKQRVLIVAVATTTELLVAWSKSVDTPLLLDVPVGDERRHLLVAKGAPLFMRIVSGTEQFENTGHAAAQNQLLRSTLELVRQANSLAGQSLSVAQLSSQGGSPSLEWDSARTVAALMAGAELTLLPCREVQDIDEMVVVEPVFNKGVQQPLASTARGYLHAPVEWLKRVLNKQQDAIARWNPRRYSWLKVDALQSSNRQLRVLAKVNQLRVVTVAFAVFGILLIFAASVYGIGGAMSRDSQMALRVSNIEQANALIEQASVIHPMPDAVADSMQMIDDFNSSAAVGPDSIVSIVARAMSTIPQISLDSLVWKASNNEESYDDLFTSIDRVEARHQYWLKDPANNRVRVEVAGDVFGRNLSAQKKTLDEFVRALQNAKSVSQVVVVESPVDSALYSELVSGKTSQYRVSLDIVSG